MEKLNNIFFTLMARGPDGNIFFSLIFFKEIMEVSQSNMFVLWFYEVLLWLYLCSWSFWSERERTDGDTICEERKRKEAISPMILFFFFFWATILFFFLSFFLVSRFWSIYGGRYFEMGIVMIGLLNICSNLTWLWI